MPIAVDEAARVARRQQCDRDRERQRDDQRVEQQLEGGRQAVAEDRRHRLVAGQRVAEVAREDAAQPVEVADEERIVEVELVAELLQLLGRGVDAQQLLGGVARQQLDDREGQERHAPQDGDRRRQPVADQPQGRRTQGERRPRPYGLIRHAPPPPPIETSS